jgi:hypothetical protein
MEAQETFMPGDPAKHVLGKPEEQAARVHKPLPKKQVQATAKTILADIRLRRQELEPVVEEYRQIKRAYEALKGI